MVELSKKESARLARIYEPMADNFAYADGITFLERFIKKNPNTYDEGVFYYLGLFYDHLAQKQLKRAAELERKARAMYRKILRHDPDSPRGWWGLARVWWHRGSRRALPYARKAYLSAQRKKDDVGGYARNIGSVYQHLGNYRNAERWFLKSLAIDSSGWGTYLNLMNLYTTMGDTAKASQCRKKIRELLRHETPTFKKTRWGKILTRLSRDH